MIKSAITSERCPWTTLTSLILSTNWGSRTLMTRTRDESWTVDSSQTFWLTSSNPIRSPRKEVWWQIHHSSMRCMLSLTIREALPEHQQGRLFVPQQCQGTAVRVQGAPVHVVGLVASKLMSRSHQSIHWKSYPNKRDVTSFNSSWRIRVSRSWWTASIIWFKMHRTTKRK